jgi:hypothetical protein
VRAFVTVRIPQEMRERPAIPEPQVEIARAGLATNFIDDRVGLVSITTANVALRLTKVLRTC